MSLSKEFVSTDDDSSEEEVNPKKKQKREHEDKKEKAESNKKVKKDTNDKEHDGIWDLGNNRQVNVRDFKGKLYVDIREMYYDKDLNMKPGKKGICLNMTQWRKLLSVIDEVDKVVKSKC